ncbi:restriction endonuclease subunit S [Clostridia bacterium]|nr:restriction endonuclease subunit S [Clostridia bacterium]
MERIDKNVKSPLIRFAGFEDEWERRRLKEGASEIGDGLHGTPKYDDVGDVFFVNGNNLVNGKIVITPETNKVTTDEQSKADKTLDKNTILISINGTIGNLAWYNNEKLMLGKSIAFIKVDGFDKKFIYTFLQTSGVKTYYLNSLTGTTIKNLGLKAIRETPIKVPKLQEQTKIGKFFKEIDHLLTIHQSEYDKLATVKKSLLQKMFPQEGETVPEIRFAGYTVAWEQRPINDLADRYDNLRIPIKESNRVSGRTPYYGSNGIQDYVEGYTHDGEFILVAEDGANDLKNYPVQYVNGRVWVNNHAHVLQSKTQIADNRFLMFAIQQTDIEPFLVGGGRAKLNADAMMKIVLCIPELAEQKPIGKLFQELNALLTIHQRELSKLQKIKKALLQKMFV